MEEETENTISKEVGDSSTNLEDTENVLSNPVSKEVGDLSTKLEDTENVLSKIESEYAIGLRN